MLVVYKKMAKAEIRRLVTETLPRLEKWFADNPKRRICNVEFVYGKMIKVRSGHVKEDLKAALDEVEREEEQKEDRPCQVGPS